MNIGNDMGQQFMFPKFRTGYYPQLPDKCVSCLRLLLFLFTKVGLQVEIRWVCFHNNDEKCITLLAMYCTMSRAGLSGKLPTIQLHNNGSLILQCQCKGGTKV